MIYNKKFSNPYSGGDKLVQFDTPSECPICHKQIEPVFLCGSIDTASNASVMLYCKGCHNSFISRYKDLYLANSVQGIYACTYEKSEPIKFEEVKFDESINKISSNFSKIYNQASQAEKYSLNEIAGIGYRKALEFLIKDFCILLHPDQEQDIKKKLLSKCINEYLTEYKPLQNVSTVAYWLGNDETHYIKELTSNDINDLKNYLDAVILYVQLEANNGAAKEIIQKRYSQKNQ